MVPACHRSTPTKMPLTAGSRSTPTGGVRPPSTPPRAGDSTAPQTAWSPAAAAAGEPAGRDIDGARLGAVVLNQLMQLQNAYYNACATLVLGLLMLLGYLNVSPLPPPPPRSSRRGV